MYTTTQDTVKGLIEKRNELNNLIHKTVDVKKLAYLKQAKAGCEHKINCYLR